MKKILIGLALIIFLILIACGNNEGEEKKEEYKITFDANGGMGGPKSIKVEYGKNVPELTGDAPERSGYNFSGYYDIKYNADDNADEGAMFYTGDLAPVNKWNKKSNGTLYAYWTTLPVITVVFYSNYGDGSISVQSVNRNSTITLTANSFLRTGYAFAGWALEAKGNVIYADEDTVSIGDSSLHLYAIWNANAYTINFDVNSGSGGQTETVTAIFGSPMPSLSAAAPVLTGFVFTGYYDAPSNGVRYYNADLTSARDWNKTQDADLYAGWKNFSVQNNNSIVSLVRAPSAITSASQFTYADIKAMVDEAIKLAGGLEGIVKPGDVIVLKPNIVTTVWNWSWPGGAKIPVPSINGNEQSSANGIVTDWRIVQAVAENIRTIIGPKGDPCTTGRILVMEASAQGQGTAANGTAVHFSNANYNLTTTLTAVDELIALDNIGGSYWNNPNPNPLPDGILKIKLPNPVFNEAYFQTPQFGGGQTNYQSYDGQGNYFVVKQIYEADVLISLPVLKHHNPAGVTGSIKNIAIGTLPPKVYGNSADNIGRNDRVPHNNTEKLQKWLADYFSVMPADFVIMDALNSSDQGPLPPNQSSAFKNLRSILASADPLAVDTVQANIMNMNYATVPHLTYLTQRGEVGTKEGKRITVRGNPKDITVIGNIKVDDLRTRFEGSLFAGVSRLTAQDLVKPAVSIASAKFSETVLYLYLNVSENIIKIDIYIDDEFLTSANNDLDQIIIDASTIIDGSHNIKVYAYTRFMAHGEALITAVK